MGGLYGFLLFNSSKAQFGIGVAPPRFEFFVEAGSNFSQSFAMFTQEEFNQTIKPSVEDWTLSPLGKVVIIPANQSPHSASDWVTLSVDPFELGALEQKTIDFSISVPSETVPGSYWTALTLTTEPIPLEDQQGVSVQAAGRLAVIVYVHVLPLSSSVETLDLYLDEETNEIVALVQNMGDSVLRLSGNLNLLDTSGEIADTVELKDTVLLRESLAEIRTPLPENLSENIILATLLLNNSSNTLELYGEVNLP